MNDIRKKNSADWTRIDDALLQKTRVFDLRSQRMRSPDGNYEDDFYYIHSPDWVNVIPLTPAGEVVLVRQFRHGIRAQSLETPGGLVDSPEDDPRQTALDELKQETGYETKELLHLGSIHPNPAMLTNRCHIYFADGVVKTSEQNLDASEDICVVHAPMREIPALIHAGEISHAVVLSAFFLLFQHRPELFRS